jgi:hypothetical protein
MLQPAGFIQTKSFRRLRLLREPRDVVLVPEARRRSNSALYVVGTSDASGRFTLRGIAPGDYKVFAWESIPAFAYQNAAFIAKHEDRGKIVRVGQSGTATAELTIIPAVERI